MRNETQYETEVRLSQARIRAASDAAIKWLADDRARALKILKGETK